MTNDSSAILRAWTRILEHNLEAGQIPVLSLGLAELGPEVMAGLTALVDLGSRRTGIVAPIISVGGDGALWLTALGLRGGRPADDLALTTSGAAPVLYTGLDMATHMASTNLLFRPAPESDKRAGGAELPAGVGWLMAPSDQPGAANRWDGLPFLASISPAAPVPAADYLLGTTVLIVVMVVLVSALLL